MRLAARAIEVGLWIRSFTKVISQSIRGNDTCKPQRCGMVKGIFGVVGKSLGKFPCPMNSELEEEATVRKYRTWEEDHDGTVPGYDKKLWSCP